MREAEMLRETKETVIEARLCLEPDVVQTRIDTGIGFFDHMLELLAFHSGFGLQMSARGDLHVDDHHTVEDCGIVLGELFRQAVGDRKGIARYGNMMMPMDETLANVTVDISGRPFLVYNCELKREAIGAFSCEMLEEFLRAFAMAARVTLHVNVLYGSNDHHKAEAVFKGLGRALRQAVQINGTAIPSSKGVLE